MRGSVVCRSAGGVLRTARTARAAHRAAQCCAEQRRAEQHPFASPSACRRRHALRCSRQLVALWPLQCPPRFGTAHVRPCKVGVHTP